MYMFLKFYFILGLIFYFELFKNCYIMKFDWRLINIRVNEKFWEWDFVRVVRYWIIVKIRYYWLVCLEFYWIFNDNEIIVE